MPLDIIFFLTALSFLSGIVFASFGLSFVQLLIPAVILFAALFSQNFKIWIALLAGFLMMAGGFYYLENDYQYRLRVKNLPESIEVRGVVISDPKRSGDFQAFYLKTDYGKILVETDFLSQYAYGDVLMIKSVVKKPSDNSYGNYLAKEGLVGVAYQPAITKTDENEGNYLTSFFIGVKRNLKNSFSRFLSPDQAALLSGIMLGVNDGFSENFSRNLSLSGVRHLTAVSGLHMTITLLLISRILAYLLPRKFVFIFSFIFIFIFTAVVGFTVSAVRASIMAFIAGLARETERFYTSRNALALAASVLALINPKVLVFDIGFQLSFLAVISILYFLPILRRFLFNNQAAGFLNWKDSLLTIASAQIAAAPVLITQFHNFSLTAFLANALILFFVPLIMSLGFLLGLSAFTFSFLAVLVSWIIAPLLDYVIFVVNFSARWAVLFNPNLGLVGLFFYYLAFILIMFYFYPSAQKLNDANK